jgi:hypothetical protein
MTSSVTGTALSTLVQLESLIVGFHSPASSPPSSITPPPAQCITLASLTFLDFHGTSEYLEEFVAIIGFPSPRKIAIMLFNQIFFEHPQFCQFISRLNALGLLTSVYVTHSVKSVSVTLVKERISLNTSCILKISCTRLDWQLSFATQILTQLSGLLYGVRLLSTEKDGELPAWKEDVDSTLAGVFQPFTHVRQVFLWRTQLIRGCTGSGHGGHAPRHTSRADFAIPKGLSQFPICGESCCAVCCFALRRGRLSDRTVSLFN